MEIKSIRIDNEKDFKEVFEREDVPKEVKDVLKDVLKDIFKNDEDTDILNKLYTATHRYKTNLDVTFGSNPENWTDKQMELYTKAFNKCSQILEKCNKEARRYE